MDSPLGKPFDVAADGENNPIEFDLAYPLRGKVPDAIDWIRQHHGETFLLLPISGGSCGGGIMQFGAPAGQKVIGLRFDPPYEPRIQRDQNIDLADLGPDEIAIDSERERISAGAAITLAQMNQALRMELGSTCRVLGADLTSYQYAAVGATFMTGGMGPQRRYFSDSVSAAAIYEGEAVNTVDGDALNGYAGTYGWSGLVTAVECRYYRFPQNEIAFTLPVSDDSQALARLLARLAPFANLRFNDGNAQSDCGRTDLLLGIEHVSSNSMQPLLDQGQSSPVSRRALDLRHKCERANADGLLFINGLSAGSTDDFLMNLVDDIESDTPCIAGIAIEHAELFADPEEMRDLREAIPYAARMQMPACKHLYKNHTDAVVKIRSGQEASVMAELWRINREYVDSVRTFIAGQDGVQGEILVYGHLNPQGVDPHNRVTMGCDDPAGFDQARIELQELRKQYYRSLANLCSTGNASLVGGEKTADSEREIFAALGGPENAPSELYRRFKQQQETVQSASPMFNWRAPAPYR